MPNQVTLTFGAETREQEEGFDRVGRSAQRMGDRVHESAGGFDRAGEAADGAEGKAQGFSDTLTGVADIGSGTAEIMKGNLFEGFVTVGTGMADLAGGMAEFLIPMLGKAKTAIMGMNFAFLSSPITWIILGIAAIVAIIVVIAVKTDWFSRAWRASWGAVRSAASNTWDFIRKIPGWLGSTFSRIGTAIVSPFRAGFNGVARAWNNTIGRLSWTVPGWVPLIGGNSISVPHLPTFHAGGTVPGVVGTAVPILAQAGETVSGVASGGGGRTVTVRSDGSAFSDFILDTVASAVRRAGGDPDVLNLKIA